MPARLRYGAQCLRAALFVYMEEIAMDQEDVWFVYQCGSCGFQIYLLAGDEPKDETGQLLEEAPLCCLVCRSKFVQCFVFVDKYHTPQVGRWERGTVIVKPDILNKPP